MELASELRLVYNEAFHWYGGNIEGEAILVEVLKFTLIYDFEFTVGDLTMDEEKAGLSFGLERKSGDLEAELEGFLLLGLHLVCHHAHLDLFTFRVSMLILAAKKTRFDLLEDELALAHYQFGQVKLPSD